MSAKEILQNIKKLPFDQRLLIIEKTLKTLNQTQGFNLEQAANSLSKEYKSNKNLTAFTDLDFERFYEAR